MTLLRDAGRGDAETVARLHTRSWQSAYRGILPDAYLDGPLIEEKRQHWQKVLSAPPAGAVILLAEAPQRPVGFIAAYPEPGQRALIDNLHVLPDHHRGGVGRRLLAGAAARLIEGGVRSARLTVYAANAPAIAFYRRTGGECVGRAMEEQGGVSASVLEFVWVDLARLAEAV